jgi:NitT/TauT family transport system substrate-binding protein
MQDALAGYLAMLEARAPQAIGGQLPDDDFYYLG